MVPFYDEVFHTPEEALADHHCPECGRDFKKVNAVACLNAHWLKPGPDNIDGDEGRRRKAMLMKYIEDNNVQTTTATRR